MDVPEDNRLEFFFKVYGKHLSNGENKRRLRKVPFCVFELIASILSFVQAEKGNRDLSTQNMVKYIVLTACKFSRAPSVRTIRERPRLIHVSEFHEIIVALTKHSGSYFEKPRTNRQKNNRIRAEKGLKKALEDLMSLIYTIQQKSLMDVAIRHLVNERPDMFSSAGWEGMNETLRLEQFIRNQEE